MTLLETYNMIRTVAKSQPNVGDVNDNIYDLNDGDTVYPAISIQQLVHTSENGFMNYRFNIFYTDMLTSDKSNKIDIQSAGISVLNNIRNTIDESPAIELSFNNYQVFTQKFEAECAGVYAEVQITVPEDTCANIYKGDFNNDFNNDFNRHR